MIMASGRKVTYIYIFRNAQFRFGNLKSPAMMCAILTHPSNIPRGGVAGLASEGVAASQVATGHGLAVPRIPEHVVPLCT